MSSSVKQLAVRRRPVVRHRGDDEDVAVEAHLLAVVLPDVRVIPVRAGIRNAHFVGEGLSNWDRRLRVVRAVESVFKPEAVPVHGCLQIAAVRDVDGHGRALRELQRRSGNRSVVGEHAHRRVADSLRNGGDLEVEGVAVG